jgi:hypothetical protein
MNKKKPVAFAMEAAKGIKSLEDLHELIDSLYWTGFRLNSSSF